MESGSWWPGKKSAMIDANEKVRAAQIIAVIRVRCIKRINLIRNENGEIYGKLNLWRVDRSMFIDIIYIMASIQYL
jgi:hypothetical protein